MILINDSYCGSAFIPDGAAFSFASESAIGSWEGRAKITQRSIAVRIRTDPYDTEPYAFQDICRPHPFAAARG